MLADATLFAATLCGASTASLFNQSMKYGQYLSDFSRWAVDVVLNLQKYNKKTSSE